MLAIAAAILYAVAFVLHQVGKGTDATGVFYLACVCLAVHLALVFPWRYHR